MLKTSWNLIKSSEYRIENNQELKNLTYKTLKVDSISI